MERKHNEVRVFCIKTLKIFLTPISRLRKLLRKSNTRQIKISIAFIAIISCIAIVTYLYRLSIAIMYDKIENTTSKRNVIGTPMRHVPLDEVYKDIRQNVEQDSLFMQDQRAGMVDTPGCKIPVAMVDYEKYLKNDKKAKNFRINSVCGKRAVFLQKIGDHKVKARIKTQVLKTYAKTMTLSECCYQFILESMQYPHDKPKLIFSNCTKFDNDSSITLQSDFINIKCSANDTNNVSHVIYDDMFAFAKKKFFKPYIKKNCKHRYNVLLLGMDTMSLPRAVKTMPRTTAFLKDKHWLGFRGYHKIADNTFPNLIAVFTGKNISAIKRQCAERMDECKRLLIWNAFKKYGYVTAYGEDYIRLPDTFAQEYEFHQPPTDHYMKPFFLKGETKRQDSPIVCAGKAPSAQQTLNYALDFAHTYKKDLFFGLFWLNSFSHDANSRPQDADKMLENFFNQLTYTGILSNTFVVFFSDHGIRFGDDRLKIESYYDDRMPMNFLWIPFLFKGNNAYEVRAIAMNQFRLTTPYDLYSTLLEIRKISTCINVNDSAPEGCPNCHSMFQVISSNRTCKDAAIHDKWCSCHKLYPLPVQDRIGLKSVHLVVNHVKDLVKKIETQECWGCMQLSLKTVHRIHFYYDKDKISLYYVVAFTMTPGNTTYEATVLHNGDTHEHTVIGPVSVISNYRGIGKCALKRTDRLFCVCQKKENCS